MASPNENPPTKYGVLLFPGFQALDVFGPLDILNILSKYHRPKPMDLVVVAATLDPVSTTVSDAEFGQRIVPTHTFDTAPEDIEVLLVPGGMGTREDAIAGPAIAYVKKIFPKLRYLLTVCTGSALVAQAGLLEGKRATTNKTVWKWATAQGPNVDWVLEARWVTDNNIWTSSGISAGISAGIDMMYAFVSAMYGEETAQDIADVSEYRRNTDPTDDPFVKLADV
ncbi:class I glutamine amidotransferase-like protein [Pseudomassariella vexata]|uniref:Class I glutamine amidotransferase-like protein n=1 Tax=Pseudomassariella vexata TaxID=1141098 RepID=A0A1Y2DR33_9PEZI|nr:class I glutamine amidotransferase-like protein [Pseudomassariella vexata]ORY61748.1 class I glutamine amidotransferase-like protein [Pseudomassariella vexata]